jgi:hypothetical protein
MSGCKVADGYGSMLVSPAISRILTHLETSTPIFHVTGHWNFSYLLFILILPIKLIVTLLIKKR